MTSDDLAGRARQRGLVRRGYDTISLAYRDDDGCAAASSAEDVSRYAGWVAELPGRGNLWAAVAVTDKHGDYEAAPAPRERAALTRWFRGTCGTLLAALDTDPSGSAWTIAPPPTVGFWQRRRCLETLIHRWDAEHALRVTGPVDPALAADGVAEVVDTMAPRQVRLGRTTSPPHAIRLRAADTGSSWILGPGEPVATLDATAATLLLVLWGRLSAEDPAVTWTGDRQKALALLSGPLVP